MLVVNLLLWLDTNYLSVLPPKSKNNFPQFNADYLLEKNGIAFNIPRKKDLLKIYNIGNPGWGAKYYNKDITNHEDITINTDGDNTESWFNRFIDYEFSSNSSPMYLSVIIAGLRAAVLNLPFDINNLDELDKMHQNLKMNNPLLHWLEELYYKYCEWDDWDGWGIGYGALGFDMISGREGWIIVFSLEEVDLADKPFKPITKKLAKGEVNILKYRDKVVIKAPYGTLEDALYLFKDWVEGV